MVPSGDQAGSQSLAPVLLRFVSLVPFRFNPWVREVERPHRLDIHPRDAASRGLAEGDVAVVWNDRGRFVERSDDRGVLQLEGMRELREYCYAVAGIVGELLTELFLLGCPKLASVGSELRQRAGAFGEGLQLVNILKGSAGDAIEGRNYLPLGVDRGEVFEIARRDLEQAVAYCLTIQKAGAPDGIVAFTALPVELAWATLDRVERHGPGSKIPRHLVFQLHRRVEQAIAEGRPVLSSKLSDQEGD